MFGIHLFKLLELVEVPGSAGIISCVKGKRIKVPNLPICRSTQVRISIGNVKGRRQPLLSLKRITCRRSRLSADVDLPKPGVEKIQNLCIRMASIVCEGLISRRVVCRLSLDFAETISIEKGRRSSLFCTLVFQQVLEYHVSGKFPKVQRLSWTLLQ